MTLPESIGNGPQLAPQRPIAIFGGTFDPVHYGHLRAASEVQEALGRIELRILPAGTPPHRAAPRANPQQRLDMLRLVLDTHNDFVIDEREVHRHGPSYMADTLSSLRHEYPQTPLILVLGQDAANQLLSWQRWRQLFDFAHLVVMTRPESPSAYPTELKTYITLRQVSRHQALHENLNGHVLHLPVTQLAISSTDIRHQIASGSNPRFLLPEAVRHYIQRNRLYLPTSLNS